MNNIHVKVYVTKKVRTPPISVVYGSTGVGIEMEVMDYDLPAGSTAEARATGKFAAEVYKNPCTVDGNIITMYPETGFFVPGGNEFQVVITAAGKNILSFVMDAICDKDIGDGNDPAKPEQVLPLVQRAENAATQSEAAAARSEAVKDSIPADYTELSNGVNQIKDDLNSLLSDVNALHPLTITAFSVSPSLAEKGSTVSAQSFHYSVNRLGAAVTLEGEAVSGGTASRTDVLVGDRVYTLTATLGDEVRKKTAKLAFVAPVYYGVGTEFKISAMTRALQTSRSMSFTVNAGAGQYILFALPVALGAPTFKVGGFDGGFDPMGTQILTNASGYKESYQLYRSTNAGLGSTTVNVS